VRTFGTKLSVPAGPDRTAQLPADALTQVSVAGTHRRQGLLRGMITRSLANARDRGEAVSYLRAAEWQIYGRFGYRTAAFAANYRIHTANPLLAVLPAREPVEIRQVEPAEARQLVPAVLDRVRQCQHGHIERLDAMWDHKLGLHPGDREPVCVVARNPEGRIDGYALWTPNEGDWFHEPDQHAQAKVHEVLAATEDAERALWNYLIHIDLVRALLLSEYPIDLPLEWLLTDGRAARRTWIGDDYWLRILDLPAALAARRYAVTDRLVLEVVDAEGGYAQGRYLLDAGPEHAECRPSTENADLQLSQRALAGIYLGGSTVRAQLLSGLLEEETPGAAHRLQLMFATERAPWNASPF
jgi:predicted acetyltransferase